MIRKVAPVAIVVVALAVMASPSAIAKSCPRFNGTVWSVYDLTVTNVSCATAHRAIKTGIRTGHTPGFRCKVISRQPLKDKERRRCVGSEAGCSSTASPTASGRSPENPTAESPARMSGLPPAP